MKQLFVFLSCIFFLSQAFAQPGKYSKRKANLPYFEEQRMHFGFSLGVNSANFKIKYDLTTYDSLISMQVAGQTGFNIGFMGSLRFTDHLTLRFLPTLAFAQRNVDYVFQSEPQNITNSRIIESTYVMFPLLMKYRSQRYKNFAAYLVAGGNLAYDLSSQFDVNNEVVVQEQVLKVQRANMLAEIGFGADFFLEYFKFSIELKYSHGVSNVFVDDNSFWAKPIEEIRPQIFSVTLLFEG